MNFEMATEILDLPTHCETNYERPPVENSTYTTGGAAWPAQ